MMYVFRENIQTLLEFQSEQPGPKPKFETDIHKAQVSANELTCCYGKEAINRGKGLRRACGKK
jgi:hypothetical protein